MLTAACGQQPGSLLEKLTALTITSSSCRVPATTMQVIQLSMLERSYCMQYMYIPPLLTCGVTCLYHELFYHSVEDVSIVVPFAGVHTEVLYRLRTAEQQKRCGPGLRRRRRRRGTRIRGEGDHNGRKRRQRPKEKRKRK